MSDSENKSMEDPVFTVDALLKYMGNDLKGRTVVARIVRDGLAAGEEPLKLAAQAVRAGRHAEAADIFHGLRGSVGTLGTKRFVKAALALELAIKENRLDDLPGLLAKVEHEFELVREQAGAWLAHHAPPA